MVKNIVVSSVLLAGALMLNLAQAASCKTLQNFDQLSANLKAGRQVRIISNFQYCKSIASVNSTMAVQVIGGASISQFIYLTKAKKIITSNAPLVLMPKGNYAYNYVRYTIDDNGTVDVFTSSINAKTRNSKTLGEYICHFGQGKNLGIRFQICG